MDVSTLKTLCMQHGSLQLFHFQPETGIALVKYTNRDQASKARSALHQCLLGNSNIIAEQPNEQQVTHILAALQQQQTQPPPPPPPTQSALYAGSLDTIPSTSATVASNWSAASATSGLWSYPQMPIGTNGPPQSNGANNAMWQAMDVNASSLLPGNLLGEST